MTTTTSVHLDVTSDSLTVADVQAFLRGAAVLGAEPADPVERVLDEMDTEERVVGLRVQGGALTGTAPATVEIDRATLLRLYDALDEAAGGDGDVRGLLPQLRDDRNWLRDVLLGR